MHLIHAELHDELRAAGFVVAAGQMGENITTRGIALLDLPTGTRLRLGAEAVIEITGLRNPCSQLESIQRGLMAAVLDRDAEGNLIRKAGVMAVVIAGGVVRPNDRVTIELPPLPPSAATASVSNPLPAFGHPPPCRERAWATSPPDGDARVLPSPVGEGSGVRFGDVVSYSAAGSTFRLWWKTLVGS